MPQTFHPRARQLGDFIHHRRKVELRLSMRKLWLEHDGPTPQTQVKWEKGKIPELAQDGTFNKYERSLSLPDETFERILTPPEAGIAVLGPETWVDLSAKLHQMHDVLRNLRAQAATLPEIREAVDALSDLQSDVLFGILEQRTGMDQDTTSRPR